MPVLLTILAADGGEFFLYIAAVIVFMIIAAVVNRVQQWWEELNRPASGRPGQRPRTAPPRSAPPRPTPSRPTQPTAPARRHSTSLPRPVIREQFPEPPPAAPHPPVVRGPAPRPVSRQTRPPARRVEVRDQRSRRQAPTPPPPASAPASVVAELISQRAAAAPEGRSVPRESAASRRAPTPLITPGTRFSRDELRRAIILMELLSPPLAIRDEPIW